MERITVSGAVAAAGAAVTATAVAVGTTAPEDGAEWLCEMNPRLTHNSCAVPEEALGKDELEEEDLKVEQAEAEVKAAAEAWEGRCRCRRRLAVRE